MKPFNKINPVIKATPLAILLSMIVPQLLLVLFRTHSLTIVKGMITEHHVLIHANYIGIPLGMASLALWMVLGSRRRGGDLPRWNMLVFFLLQAASLVYFLVSLQHLIPEGVDDWIMPIGPFVMLQLASAMPGLFFGFIGVANIRLFNKAWINIAASFGVLVMIPASLYFIMIASPYWRLPDALVIALCVVTTLVAAFAFIQLLLWLSGRMRHNVIPTVLFALVFPIAGLILNHWIPFPADLQHWGFYALTMANAAILLWACHPSSVGKPICGLAMAFSYPFTCYFFFLFLPFLPFSLFAMIAAGAGFLILAPTLLFILHTRQLVLQFQSLRIQYRIGRIAIGFLIAFLLVPAAYVGRALYHKQIFFKTLDHVYAASFENPGPMPAPDVAGYALKQLIKTKEGLYVPILSEVYNRIVFGGMVLPDHKIKQLSQLLLEEDYDAGLNRGDFSFYSFFTDESRRTSGRFDRPPSRNVSLTDTDCSTETKHGETEATVLLTLKNNIDWQAEYVADITIPGGLFVSGYELKIGDEMVPARLSDRKAAMWVYHMIRDHARRDPGLVVYTAPNTLRLSVFPLAGNEQRQCALKFLYPEGAAPEIRIGEKTIVLPDGKPATTLVATAAGRQAVCIPAEVAQTLPGVFRTLEKTALPGTDTTPGYCPEWDVKRALLAYWNSGEKQLETVPWFFTETEQPLIGFDRAAYWMPLIPDGGWSDTAPAKMEVLSFRCGKQVRVIPKQSGGMIVFENNDPINFTADRQLDADSRYAQAIDVWQAWWQTQLHPEQEEALRKELLEAAREINILVPSTAFLVVESTAQQKALEKAENQSLKSHTSLAFDEFQEKGMTSPEPGLLLLLLCAVPILHGFQRKRSRHENR